MPSDHPNNPHDRLRFGGRVVSRDMADDDPRGWVKLLETARAARLPMECLCRGAMEPLQMFMARHGNTMVLKRAPGSGLDHHPLCPSHGHSTGDVRAQVVHPAVEILTHGGLRVSLDAPLTRLVSAAAKPKSPRQPIADASR